MEGEIIAKRVDRGQARFEYSMELVCVYASVSFRGFLPLLERTKVLLLVPVTSVDKQSLCSRVSEYLLKRVQLPISSGDQS